MAEASVAQQAKVGQSSAPATPKMDLQWQAVPQISEWWSHREVITPSSFPSTLSTAPTGMAQATTMASTTTMVPTTTSHARTVSMAYGQDADPGRHQRDTGSACHSARRSPQEEWQEDRQA